MAYVENDEVKLPQGRRDLPRNPLLRTLSTSSTRSGSSTRGSVDQSREDKTPRNRLYKRDQRDLLTGGVSASLHAARSVDAMRSRKALVEGFLTRQCILGSDEPFDLDSIVNIFLFEASLLRLFNLHNFLAILPVKDHLQVIADQLERHNVLWDHQCLTSKPPRVVARPLVFSLSAFTTPTWQVLVLQHKAWFNEGRFINIFSRPHLADNIPQDLGDPATLWEAWTTFETDDNSVLRHRSSKRPRLFVHCRREDIPVEIRTSVDSGEIAHIPTNRTREEYLSPICLILNAHDKFTQAITNNYPSMGGENSEMRAIAKLCREIVEKFFYRPSLPTLQAKAAAENGAPSSCGGQEGSGGLEGHRGVGVDSTATVRGHDSQLVVDEDEDDRRYIDPYTGREHLSHNEFKLAMAQVEDAEIPVSERMELFYVALRGIEAFPEED